VAERKLGQVVDRVTDRLSPEEQLEVLMDAYEQPLYAFLVAVVGTPDLAADCAQDTFLRAYQHLRRRRLVSKSWLYRVAHNRAMDEYRRRA
jgi:RNA polymerase sigma-70 factor (ECF subfamily)